VGDIDGINCHKAKNYRGNYRSIEGNPLYRREETIADYVDKLDLYTYRISSSDLLRFSIESPTRDVHRVHYSYKVFRGKSR